VSQYLYLTADQVGLESGGGTVTKNEAQALSEFAGLRHSNAEVWGRKELEGVAPEIKAEEPWDWDRRVLWVLKRITRTPKLTHIYAGTFSLTVEELKKQGCKVAYTCAAHDVAVSRREHEALGIPYARLYPHLVEPKLWERYLAGYKAADVMVCPSKLSERVMRGFGCTNRIEIIPHGCDVPPPEMVKPLPNSFTVGYGGSYGCDKGVVYLLRAWKKLNYSDATLVLAGRESTSPGVANLIRHFGGGNIRLMGWVNKITDFYNEISMLVQPSCSEGFGLEVLEAMAGSRLALCSTGAGAADIALDTFPAMDVDALASKIDFYKKNRDDLPVLGAKAREAASKLTWESIRKRYMELWESVLTKTAA
jgi:glycosyltransferase involved in cell wall biosynthesis